MVKVGIAGIGFMGWIHWLAYQKISDIQVVAIATPEPERRKGDWTAIKGNFGPPGQAVDLTGIQTYASLVEMLDNDEIDLIDICLPPALHSDAIIQTVGKAKSAFCEKPLALNLVECDLAMEACSKNGQLLFVGHVLPFFNEYQYLRNLVDSQTYGRLLGGNFKRVISDPTWLKHFYDANIVGGPLFDLHVHDAHLIRLLFGMPISVDCVGRRRGEVVEYCQTLYRFENPEWVVASNMGVINQPGRPFQHGFEVHFERATVHFEFSAIAAPHSAEICPLKIFTLDGEIIKPELGDGDPVLAFEREIAEVVGCVKNKTPSKILAGELARDAVAICELQSQAILK
jgi:predicted dehydrogenase